MLGLIRSFSSIPAGLVNMQLNLNTISLHLQGAGETPGPSLGAMANSWEEQRGKCLSFSPAASQMESDLLDGSVLGKRCEQGDGRGIEGKQETGAGTGDGTAVPM